MPELPEVESVARDLKAAGLIGRVITDASILWPRSIAAPSPIRFRRQIKGLRVEDISRRGKYVVMTLSRGFSLLIHLRMSGRLMVARDLRARAGGAQESAPTHDRVILSFGDGRTLRFEDTRKFGRVWLVHDAAAVLGRLGPEPLALDAEAFRPLVTRHSRLLKPLLLDQTVIAGIGNIYADEALWEARLHPRRKSDALSNDEIGRLLRAIKKVLRRGLRNLGTTLGKGKTNFYLPRGESGRNQEELLAYGQTGLPCRRCGTKIARIIVGQRSTHICPKCQPATPLHSTLDPRSPTHDSSTATRSGAG